MVICSEATGYLSSYNNDISDYSQNAYFHLPEGWWLPLHDNGHVTIINFCWRTNCHSPHITLADKGWRSSKQFKLYSFGKSHWWLTTTGTTMTRNKNKNASIPRHIYAADAAQNTQCWPVKYCLEIFMILYSLFSLGIVIFSKYYFLFIAKFLFN